MECKDHFCKLCAKSALRQKLKWPENRWQINKISISAVCSAIYLCFMLTVVPLVSNFHQNFWKPVRGPVGVSYGSRECLVCIGLSFAKCNWQIKCQWTAFLSLAADWSRPICRCLAAEEMLYNSKCYLTCKKGKSCVKDDCNGSKKRRNVERSTGKVEVIQMAIVQLKKYGGEWMSMCN